MNEKEFLRNIVQNSLDGRDLKRAIVFGKKGRDRQRWLLPVTACAVAVFLVCCLVPPVRAAIVQWFNQTFHGVEDYISQPKENRGQVSDLDAMIKQAKPGEAEQAQENSIELTVTDPAWQDWADKLDPQIGDVYFDGEKLVVAFDMGGGAAEFLGDRYMSLENDIVPFPDQVGFMSGYVTVNGKTYSLSPFVTEAPIEYKKYMQYETEDSTEGEIPHEEGNEFITNEGKQELLDAKSVLFTATVDLDLPSVDNSKESMSAEDYAAWQDVIEEWRKNDPLYDPEHYSVWDPTMRMEGVQNIEISVPLSYTDYSVPGVVEHKDQYGESIRYKGGLIGMLRIRCSIDPEEGYANIKTYEIGKTMDFSGEGRFKTYDNISDPGYAICNNITKDLSGVALHVKRMVVSSSGTKLYIGVTCPDYWTDIEKGGFLGSLTFVPYAGESRIPSSGEQYGLEEGEEDMGFYMELDILPSELETIDTIRLVPVLSRYAGYDGVPFEEGKPTKIKEDEILGWQEKWGELTRCTFDFQIDRS